MGPIEENPPPFNESTAPRHHDAARAGRPLPANDPYEDLRANRIPSNPSGLRSRHCLFAPRGGGDKRGDISGSKKGFLCFLEVIAGDQQESSGGRVMNGTTLLIEGGREEKERKRREREEKRERRSERSK